MDDSLPQRGLGNGGHKWTLNQADPRFRSESAIAFFSKNATVRSYPAHPSLVKSTTACLFLQFKPKEDLVGTSGLEPPTSRLSGVRSNHLSYAPMAFKWLPHSFPCGFRHGGDEEDRTPDPLLAKQVLSQLSYTPAGISGLCFPPLFPSSHLGT